MAQKSHIFRIAAGALFATASVCAGAQASSQATVTPSTADSCYTDWSTAIPIVQREALAAVREVHAQARVHKVGDVVRVTLCTEQGRFVYRLVVREPQGRVVPMTVDARRPFGP
jgi:invasion protein IalB